MCRELNEESEAERLLSCARRAFKHLDSEENGFIMADKLGQVLFGTQMLKMAALGSNILLIIVSGVGFNASRDYRQSSSRATQVF